MAGSLLPAPPPPAVVDASATGLSPAEQRRLQAAIVDKAPRFTLGALLDALHALGYRDDEIDLRSHASAAHQSCLIAAVEFRSAPLRRVTVQVNLGLLSAQSVLPSYFQRVAEKQAEGTLSAFLGFFAQHLLRDTARGQFPERDAALFPAWPQTLAQLRSLLGLRSPAAVHWVFASLYPELGVTVARTVMSRSLRSRGVRVGSWAMGDGAVLGAVTTIPVSGVAVRLFSDELLSTSGKPWAREAGQRLQKQLFPLLAGYGLHLEVSLLLGNQRNYMVLRHDQFLGYQPLRGGPVPQPGDAAARPPAGRTIILWSGEVPSDAA